MSQAFRRAFRRAFRDGFWHFEHGAGAAALLRSRRRVLSLLALGGGTSAVAFAGGWAAAEPYLKEEKHTSKLFRDARRSVVFVTKIQKVYNIPSLFPVEENSVQSGYGSGFVWDSEGHIITNYHVIKDASQLVLEFPGGQKCKAKIVGVDEKSDLAVLKVPRKMLHHTRALPRPSSSDGPVEVGQFAYAIGYHFGLDLTLTSGIVSGVGRRLAGNPRMFNLIQTDAAINPGSSGGPLLDSRGQLIGVNTAILTPSGGFSGVGYAIPVKFVEKIVSQLIEKGRVTRPGLGITIAQDQALKQLNLEGALVYDVHPGKAASIAGLNSTVTTRGGSQARRLGDIITGINGKTIKNSSDLMAALDEFNVGDEIVLRLLRADVYGRPQGERNAKVVLQEQ